MGNSFADRGLCRELPAETLEELFWSGPPAVNKRPVKGVSALWAEAKAICARCPVLEECREGTAGEEFGIWGGVDQHERYLARRRTARKILHSSWEERQPLAAEAYRLHLGNSKLPRAVVARRMGLLSSTVVTLASQYVEHLESQQLAANHRRPRPIPMTEEEIATTLALADQGLALKAIARRLGRNVSTIRKYIERARPPFPSGLPDGDGWVRYENKFYRGHYVAQTGDGKFLYVKFEVDHKSMIRWTPAVDFELRRPVTPVVRAWIGRTDRGPKKPRQEAA